LRAQAASREFWATASEQLGQMGSGNPWEKLKALQFLAHFAFLNPETLNVSALAQAGTRLAIQLGLHRELPPNESSKLSPSVLNERRRLFWASYSIDTYVGFLYVYHALTSILIFLLISNKRAVHSSLCRPILWPKYSITAQVINNPRIRYQSFTDFASFLRLGLERVLQHICGQYDASKQK
jgi:hypothetical protein